MNEKNYPSINVGGVTYYPIEVDEIREMIETSVENALSGLKNKPTQQKFIRGIHGLAKFLNVSPAKAQEIKNSGKIPFTQNGRVVLFDANEIIEALKTPAKKK